MGATQRVDILRILWSWECISVVRTPSGEFSRASGLFVRKDDSVLIVLNSGRTLGHQFFTAAHELYHVRFNEGMTGRACTAMQFSDKQPDEMDADRFAAHLLLPRAGIDAMLAKHATDAEPSWPTILRLEQYFRVSHEAMLWRLLDVGYFRNRKQMEEYRPGVIRQARMLRYDTSIYRPGGAHEVLSEVPEKTHRAIEQGLISQGWANELLDAMGVDHSDAGRVDDDQLD